MFLEGHRREIDESWKCHFTLGIPRSAVKHLGNSKVELWTLGRPSDLEKFRPAHWETVVIVVATPMRQFLKAQIAPEGTSENEPLTPWENPCILGPDIGKVDLGNRASHLWKMISLVKNANLNSGKWLFLGGVNRFLALWTPSPPTRRASALQSFLLEFCFSGECHCCFRAQEFKIKHAQFTVWRTCGEYIELPPEVGLVVADRRSTCQRRREHSPCYRESAARRKTSLQP